MPKIVLYAVAALLVIGAFPLPYGYYTLLRIVVFIIFGCLAYEAYQADCKVTPWIFGLFVILFNPLIPVYLSKEVWMIFDVVSAGLLLWSAKEYGE